MPEQYYPVLLAMGIAIAMGIVILSLSWILGKIAGHQHGGTLKGTTIESGMPLLDVSHKRISIAFLYSSNVLAFVIIHASSKAFSDRLYSRRLSHFPSRLAITGP